MLWMKKLIHGIANPMGCITQQWLIIAKGAGLWCRGPCSKPDGWSRYQGRCGWHHGWRPPGGSTMGLATTWGFVYWFSPKKMLSIYLSIYLVIYLKYKYIYILINIHIYMYIYIFFKFTSVYTFIYTHIHLHI